ncbi:MAG TPA: hypothetical protein VF272_01330 [Candidatus Saccharimonadia bacterium]
MKTLKIRRSKQSKARTALGKAASLLEAIVPPKKATTMTKVKAKATSKKTIVAVGAGTSLAALAVHKINRSDPLGDTLGDTTNTNGHMAAATSSSATPLAVR